MKKEAVPSELTNLVKGSGKEGISLNYLPPGSKDT